MKNEQPVTSELSYGEYLKAAFNVRLRVPGLGGVPVNWLYLATVAGMSLAAWPVALVGLGGEIALLAGLSTSRRFQSAVRAQRLAEREGSVVVSVEKIVAQLDEATRRRFQQFARRCDEVMEIAGRLGNAAAADLNTYERHLGQLRCVYARMLAFADTLAEYAGDWEKSDPGPEIAQLQEQLAKGELPEAIAASKQATLELLKKRAESRAEVSRRAALLHSEIERLEQQVALLRDQALLTQDPATFSQSMDTAASVLEEHNKWLQDNANFLQSLQGMSGGA